jgi:hypothetical protein
MRAFIFSVLFMLVAGMTFAADIDGNWAGEAKGMDGNPMKVNYTFKADGATLTGSTKNPMDGSDMVIKDGKIEGTKFSYSLDMGGMALKFNGEIKGDTVELKMDMSGMGGPGGAPAGQGAPEMPPTILKKVN